MVLQGVLLKVCTTPFLSEPILKNYTMNFKLVYKKLKALKIRNFWLLYFWLQLIKLYLLGWVGGGGGGGRDLIDSHQGCFKMFLYDIMVFSFSRNLCVKSV